jgi:CheY-like chemotaxis protein
MGKIMRPVKRIFCIDDDKQITQLLRYQLKKLGYKTCGVADNALAAVKGIWKSKPDIVLVDIELHGKLEGLEIGKFLVSKTNIPFVYVTGHDNPQILEHARKTLPNGYLMKPYDCHDLKVALTRVQGLYEV